MRCLAADSSGVLSLLPAGTECAAGSLVVLTTEEASKALQNPLNLTVEEGWQVGGAILFVWATAWAFRAVVRALNIGSSEPREYD